MTRKWLSRLGLALLVWIVVCVLAYLLGNHPRPGLLALFVGACGATLWLLLDVSAVMEPAQWRFAGRVQTRAAGEDPRLGSLHRVIDQHLDAHEVSDLLRRHLLDIADRRLVSHHGISRRADPERADLLMGPELAALAAQTAPYPRMTPRAIDVLIERIEAL
jgi:hypothetical protein